MKRRRPSSSWQRERRLQALTYTLAFTAACVVIQYSSVLFGVLVEEPIEFVSVKPLHWSADVRTVPPGTYYFSAGRPRGGCELRADGRVVAANGSAESVVRETLMLGTTLDLASNTGKLEVECFNHGGFMPGLTGAPVLSKRGVGIFLHLWRGMTQILLGPAVAACLLFYLLLSLLVSARGKQAGALEREERERQWRLATLSGVSLLYAVSLSHATYLFWNPDTAMVIQVLTRSVFSLAMFCFFLAPRTRLERSVVGLYVLQLGTMAVVAAVSPRDLPKFYEVSFALFIGSAAVAAWRLAQLDGTRTQMMMFGAAASWALLQPFNIWASYFRFWENLSPALLTVMCISLVYIDLCERWSVRRAQTVNASLLSSIRSHARLPQMLTAVGTTMREAGSSDRFSAYIDRFFEYEQEGEGKRYSRVVSLGYQNFPSTFEEFDVADTTARRMKNAMSNGSLVSGRGKTDRGCYFVVPIDRYGCLNLSDASETTWRSYVDQLELFRKLGPAFETLRTRVRERAASLRRLRIEKELEGTKAWSLTASRMAHDIRSPLTALNVLADDGAMPEAVRRNLLNSAVARINRIADDLLQPQSVKSRMTKATFEELKLSCERMVDEARIRFGSISNVRLDLETSEDSRLPCVRIDLAEFERTLSNLLNNAFEALVEHGTVSVSLSGQPHQIEVRVTDTGRGISEEVLPHLGERGATFGKANGHGLGLHSVRQFAEQTNGTLSIRSALGKGTQVSLIFPSEN